MVEIIEEFVTGDDSAFVCSTASYAAQTFTIGTTGVNANFDISSVEILILADTGGTGIMTAEIFETGPDGYPTGAAVSSGTYDMSLIADDVTTWLNIAMSTVTLKASTKYALSFRISTAGTGEWQWRLDTANGYTGGTEFTTADTGATWTEVAANDLLFQIKGGDYAGTLCTLSEAINKAGANANATSTTEGLMSAWVRQAEGKISCVTEFDWVDNYAAISDDVKHILNETASEIAGIKAITYDMSGYTSSTAEAETMINVYRENINFNLGLLSRERVKDFLQEDE